MEAAAAKTLNSQGLDDADMATDQSSTIILPDVITADPACVAAQSAETERQLANARRREGFTWLLLISHGVSHPTAEVKILSLAILSPGSPDIVVMVPENGIPEGIWFTLKQGRNYRLKFTFQVNNAIVSDLCYKNSVWKSGYYKVGRTKEMLGTFSHESGPYNHVTTPSGMFAPGLYSARAKFLDDVTIITRYLEFNYNFEILEEQPLRCMRRKTTLDYPEVRILSLAILSPGIPDIVLSVPENGNPEDIWFTLKEGCKYNLKFTFQVNNAIVTDLCYKSSVWKSGLKVISLGTEETLGTFSPQLEPYNHVMPEEITPFGKYARGSYSARAKFLDGRNRRYFEINYSFDIREEWPAEINYT